MRLLGMAPVPSASSVSLLLTCAPDYMRLYHFAYNRCDSSVASSLNALAYSSCAGQSDSKVRFKPSTSPGSAAESPRRANARDRDGRSTSGSALGSSSTIWEAAISFKLLSAIGLPYSSLDFLIEIRCRGPKIKCVIPYVLYTGISQPCDKAVHKNLIMTCVADEDALRVFVHCCNLSSSSGSYPMRSDLHVTAGVKTVVAVRRWASPLCFCRSHMGWLDPTGVAHDYQMPSNRSAWI
jgi:hypothetical protein